METSLTWLGRLIETPTSAEWHHLSEVYGPLIAKWVERAGVPSASVDDVVQEVFIVVLQKVGDFEHQHPGAFRGWLRASLANQLKKYFRQNARVTKDWTTSDKIRDTLKDVGIALKDSKEGTAWVKE